MRTIERLKQPGWCRYVPLAVAICTTLPAHAAGPVFSTLVGGSGLDYATALTSDAEGNTYVAGLAYSPDFPVTPGAYQTVIGHFYYPDAFVAKISPTGQVIWATYLGGLIDDWATGVALDSGGNVWVTGATRSANFPVVNPIQSTLDNNGGTSDNFNTFLAELSPDGSQLLFSTFLGANNVNTPAAMALDSANNVYLAINTNSTTGFQGIPNGPSTSGIVVTKFSPQGTLAYSFFHPHDTAAAMALDSTGAIYVAGTAVVPRSGGPGFDQAVVFKISPDGSTQLYEKIFGGSYSAIASAIAVDRAGEAWVAGSTQSADFPLVHPLANQTTLGARPLWESTSGGAAWAPIDNLPFAHSLVMLTDPATPATLYEATSDRGVFKSVDAGATWTQSSAGIGATAVQALAIDPVHTQTLYAAAATTVYKSTNGAASWSAIDSPPFAVNQILIDAQNDNIVYESNDKIRKSTDGGSTWNSVTFPGSVSTLAIDPGVSGHLFAISQMFFCGFECTNYMPAHLYTSTDGGDTWTQVPSVLPSNSGLLVDPSTNPSTIYDGLSYQSSDGGVTWNPLLAPPFSTNISALAVDPSGNLYAAVVANSIYVSHDRGQSWTALSAPTPTWTSVGQGPTVISIVPAGSTGTLYTTVNTTGTAAFVTKLSADGSTLEYSTYLRGHSELEQTTSYAAEPATMLLQNWIDGIALDASGNVILAGGTRALDFPTATPMQSANAGGGDAFAAILSVDGSTLQFSTYFGGSRDDGAFAAALDPSGNVILAGQTGSNDFPVSGATPSYSGLGDAFVVKLAAAAPAITSVVNGASYQPGIEAGSWAMITGNNLANSTRAWQNSDFSGNNLPTSLDGVSVTLDGKPAFVAYINPTQIKVQAPSDSAIGSVSVVVNNNGSVSAPFAVALQPAAPAFFVNSHGIVVATELNYNPISASSPAAPGQIVVLWGTGFGATIPAAPAGELVSGAPATAALPTVTVGGVAAQVISSVLTTGEAGLYQVTIQIPADVPTGQVSIQASIDGLQTQPGVTMVTGSGAASADGPLGAHLATGQK